MRKASGRFAKVALLLWMGIAVTLRAEDQTTVTLHLKNGDRLTGEVLSEDGERIVLSTPWNVAIFIPRSEIEKQVAVIPASEGSTRSKTDEAVSTVVKPVEVSEAKPRLQDPTSGSAPGRWKWNLKVGTDFISGAKDREIYFGETALIYTRNYMHSPREFLRNRLEYRVDYGKTDGRVSANRMLGANKLDFDIGSGYYSYVSAGAGYDKVRKIESQYEFGPGIGYHLLSQETLALDTEMGSNYQDREGLNGAPDREVLQARLAQELTWEVAPKIILSEAVAVLPFLEDLGEYQVRLESNLGFGIVRHLSLNLTVRNLYDTLPAPTVPNNEFQVRSSLGVNF